MQMADDAFKHTLHHLVKPSQREQRIIWLSLCHSVLAIGTSHQLNSQWLHGTMCLQHAIKCWAFKREAYKTVSDSWLTNWNSGRKNYSIMPAGSEMQYRRTIQGSYWGKIPCYCIKAAIHCEIINITNAKVRLQGMYHILKWETDEKWTKRVSLLMAHFKQNQMSKTGEQNCECQLQYYKQKSKFWYFCVGCQTSYRRSRI